MKTHLLLITTGLLTPLAMLQAGERMVSVPSALSAPSSTAIGGDPTAISNVVATARWTKNIYANGDITGFSSVPDYQGGPS